MGIVNPRPAIRAAESRVIMARLKRYKQLISELEAKGIGDDATARKSCFNQAIQENPFKMKSRH